MLWIDLSRNTKDKIHVSVIWITNTYDAKKLSTQFQKRASLCKTCRGHLSLITNIFRITMVHLQDVIYINMHRIWSFDSQLDLYNKIKSCHQSVCVLNWRFHIIVFLFVIIIFGKLVYGRFHNFQIMIYWHHKNISFC